MIRQDIALSDQDLDFNDGDFGIEESDNRHVEDIVYATKGSYKEYPLIGFGAINYVKGNATKSKIKRDLKVQLSYDGYNDATIDLSKGIEQLKIQI